MKLLKNKKNKKMLKEKLIIDIPNEYNEEEIERQTSLNRDLHRRYLLTVCLIIFYASGILIHYVTFFKFQRLSMPSAELSVITFIVALYSCCWPFFGIVTIPWMIVCSTWVYIEWMFFALNEWLNLK